MSEAEAYVGWLRVGHGSPWQRVCTAATSGLCWQLLLAHPVHIRGAVVEREVTRADEKPAERRYKRARAEGRGLFEGGQG